MKIIRYSVVCLVCCLAILTTGCQNRETQVINANSGVVIRADEITGGLTTKTSGSNQIKQVSAPTAKSTGRVIHLGAGYEDIKMGQPFGNI